MALALVAVAIGIRGVIASASLKRCIAYRALHARLRIRGVIASASLKLGMLYHVRFFRAWYPRRYCLGLIEAIF